MMGGSVYAAIADGKLSFSSEKDMTVLLFLLLWTRQCCFVELNVAIDSVLVLSRSRTDGGYAGTRYELQAHNYLSCPRYVFAIEGRRKFDCLPL